MKYLLTVVCVAALTVGCGGGERVGVTRSDAASEDTVADDEDTAQGGGERVGGVDAGGDELSADDDGDAALEVGGDPEDDDQPQGGGERVSDTGGETPE